ncbi:hypothetical protein V474_19190 [Novosphingobium barchaimii LL02]|uniref:Cytochrome C oxidase assembly protein n=1 Tax=Novosphingobium barchaimii LL02 TaxID=1114963 RepID=A0A0J7XU32_9SPHN|nr:hypothetical protein [Novosphingobium barchaimii]KMS55169.1 hypothetical protein V474_19190 [Novosphingobium barchaimii LL02]
MSKTPKQHVPQSVDQIRRGRNRVLALSLGAFVVLIFFISIAKMG